MKNYFCVAKSFIVAFIEEGYRLGILHYAMTKNSGEKTGKIIVPFGELPLRAVQNNYLETVIR